jgi:hypothetical protein
VEFAKQHPGHVTGLAVDLGLEVQAEMASVVDDPRRSRNRLVVHDRHKLQEFRHRHRFHSLGGRVLHPNEMNIAALDGELGLRVEQVSACHLLKKLAFVSTTLGALDPRTDPKMDD